MKVKFIAAIAIAIMCTNITGCAGENISEEKSVTSTTNSSSTEERHLESKSTSNTESVKPAATSESSEPKEISLALTDEIKNADFESGLVQIYNDVFQQGGYITVADFIEKYGSSYILEGLSGEYEEIKNKMIEPNLLENGQVNIKSSAYQLSAYSKFTVKEVSEDRWFDNTGGVSYRYWIKLELCNPTDHDIPLTEAIVCTIRDGDDATCVFPTGITNFNGLIGTYLSVNANSSNRYLANSDKYLEAAEYFDEHGVTYESSETRNGTGFCNFSVDGKEPNKFGAIPQYTYTVNDSGSVSQSIRYKMDDAQ